MATRSIGILVPSALLWAMTANVAAQASRGTPPPATQAETAIVGKVVDAVSGRAMSQVQVTLRGTKLQAITDLEGGFALRALRPGSYALEARQFGYETLVQDSVTVRAGETVRLALSMTPAPFRLAEITVTPGSFSFLEAAPVTGRTMSRAAIQAAPFGEDLFRALNRLPGLSSGDYGAQFSIRGGRQDETLILLNGLEIYEPVHLKDFNEGALSIFDVEAMDGVDLLTGGFSARYGDKRSGVMNITSRTPTEAGMRLTLGASFANAHALAEGTFADSKGAWLVSGRRGFADVALRIISKNETKAPSYEDVFATMSYRIHPNHTLALNVLHAGDRYQFGINGTTGFNDTIRTRESADNGYGNSYAWLTLQSLVGEHLSVKTLASAGKVTASRRGDETVVPNPLELYGVEGHRDFSVLGFKQDFNYQRSDRMVLDWGYDLRSMHADFDWTTRVRQDPDNPTPDTTGYYPHTTRKSKKADGTTIGAYVSGRLQLFDPLTLDVGMRYDGATYTHDRDWSPRLHALVRLSDGDRLRAGWGQYRQRQGIADENAFDGLNRYFPSELSEQWTLGFEHRFADAGSLRVEAYHKTGSRLRPILRNWKSGLNVFPEVAEDRILVYPEAATSKGVELYLDHRLGSRVRVRGGYALAFAEERLSRIDHVNDPLKPPFSPTHPWPQDQRHAVNADVTYRLSPNWSITSALTFHSGWPITEEIGVPVRKRNGQMDLAVRPDSLYGGRLPPYQRLDVRLTRQKETRNGDFRFFLEVINLTNHENVLGYDVFVVRDASGVLTLQRDTETWFSILPSLGVSWSRRF
jgi:hypothetical protein